MRQLITILSLLFCLYCQAQPKYKAVCIKYRGINEIYSITIRSNATNITPYLNSIFKMTKNESNANVVKDYFIAESGKRMAWNSPKVENLIGNRYGKWVLIAKAEPKQYGTKRKTVVLCKCDCGNEKELLLSYIINGISKSCGCKNGKSFIKVDYTKNVWRDMKRRCTRINIKSSKNYSLRGISFCEEWNTYDNFLKDMGQRPSDLYSLERVNNDLGYFKENCVWATKKQQARNRRSSLLIEYNGQKKVLAQWCEDLSMPYDLVNTRLLRGWDIKKAFEYPSIVNLKLLEYEGVKKSIRQWAFHYNVSYNSAVHKVGKGLPFEQVFNINKNCNV